MSEERRSLLSNAYLTYGTTIPFSASNIGAGSGDILQYKAKGYIHGRPGEWRVSTIGVQYLHRYVMR